MELRVTIYMERRRGDRNRNTMLRRPTAAKAEKRCTNSRNMKYSESHTSFSLCGAWLGTRVGIP